MKKIELELDEQTLETGNLAHYQRTQALGYNLKLDNWRT
jgi:hypothetical protein